MLLGRSRPFGGRRNLQAAARAPELRAVAPDLQLGPEAFDPPPSVPQSPVATSVGEKTPGGPEWPPQVPKPNSRPFWADLSTPPPAARTFALPRSTPLPRFTRGPSPYDIGAPPSLAPQQRSPHSTRRERGSSVCPPRPLPAAPSLRPGHRARKGGLDGIQSPPHGLPEHITDVSPASYSPQGLCVGDVPSASTLRHTRQKT